MRTPIQPSHKTSNCSNRNTKRAKLKGQSVLIFAQQQVQKRHSVVKLTRMVKCIQFKCALKTFF